MPKFKGLLPNIFGGNKETNVVIAEGRLETDALPVMDNENAPNYVTNNSNTPTASTELTETLVRELADPNYNSMSVVESVSVAGGALVNGNTDNNALSSEFNSNNPTMNSMTHINNAQQQVVMNFANASNLHFGSVYNFNQNLNATNQQTLQHSRKTSTTSESSAFGGDGAVGYTAMTDSCAGNTTKRQKPLKTTSIVLMMQSQEEPNHRMLDTVATHLGEGWKEVMRELGHSDGQIEQAIIDHQMHGNIKEVIYQLLLKWIRGADDGIATLGRLTTLLWETNHRECVQRMKLVWKAQEKRKVTSS